MSGIAYTEDEDSDKPVMPDIKPFLDHYIEFTQNLGLEETQELSTEQSIFLNVVTDEDFKKNEDMLTTAIALTCDAPEKGINHGVENDKFNRRTIEEAVEFLDKIGVVDGYLYDYESELEDGIMKKNFTLHGQKIHDKFIGTIMDVPPDMKKVFEGNPEHALSPASLHAMFDVVSMFFACLYEGLNIIEVFDELGIQ